MQPRLSVLHLESLSLIGDVALREVVDRQLQGCVASKRANQKMIRDASHSFVEQVAQQIGLRPMTIGHTSASLVIRGIPCTKEVYVS